MYDGVPFSGRLVKLRLKSNASSYGPIPEPDAEVEQKLEVSVKKKTARLSCYNFGNGAKYLLNQVYVRRESEKDIMDILAMFEAVFSSMSRPQKRFSSMLNPQTKRSVKKSINM